MPFRAARDLKDELLGRRTLAARPLDTVNVGCLAFTVSAGGTCAKTALSLVRISAGANDKINKLSICRQSGGDRGRGDALSTLETANRGQGDSLPALSSWLV